MSCSKQTMTIGETTLAKHHLFVSALTWPFSLAASPSHFSIVTLFLAASSRRRCRIHLVALKSVSNGVIFLHTSRPDAEPGALTTALRNAESSNDLCDLPATIIILSSIHVHGHPLRRELPMPAQYSRFPQISRSPSAGSWQLPLARCSVIVEYSGRAWITRCYSCRPEIGHRRTSWAVTSARASRILTGRRPPNQLSSTETPPLQSAIPGTVRDGFWPLGCCLDNGLDATPWSN
jgi:hypothetical protein